MSSEITEISIDNIEKALEYLPLNIIPIHTFYPEKYSDHFNYNIMITEDKVPVEL